jgi:NAD(P)H-hydrate epimerase
MAREKMNDAVRAQREMVERLGIPLAVWEGDEERGRALIEEAEIIFDGIAGTGIKGALRAPLDALVEAINAQEHSLRVAIDVPSGLGNAFRAGMPAVRAALTLTMGLPKLPLYSLAGRPYAGRIEKVDLGFPPELLRDPPEAVELLERPEPLRIHRSAYKNSRGHCALFCGARGTTGAAALAAEAAARSGPGLTTLFADEDIYPTLAGKLSSVMVKPVAGITGEEDLSAYSAFLLGSGWGVEGRAALLELAIAGGKPGVLDADGIRVLREVEDAKGRRALAKLLAGRWVCTPHPGEFRLLLEVEREELAGAPLEYVRKAADEYGAVMLLKSHVSYVAEPGGRTAMVDGMNPAMGTGGSGDVLAGMTAGLLAAGLEPFDAACRAAGFHQMIGRTLRRRAGWFLAEDLLPLISPALAGERADHAAR